jgi:hypothetical protein
MIASAREPPLQLRWAPPRGRSARLRCLAKRLTGVSSGASHCLLACLNVLAGLTLHGGSVDLVNDQGRPPDWLDGPACAVLQDLQGGLPIVDLTVVATRIADLNGLSLGILESSRYKHAMPQLVDDLDPDHDTQYGGGNWVPRSLAGPELLVLFADILQEDLAETSQGWGQARPPCPHHPHPARPVCATERPGGSASVSTNVSTGSGTARAHASPGPTDLVTAESAVA